MKNGINFYFSIFYFNIIKVLVISFYGGFQIVNYFEDSMKNVICHENFVKNANYRVKLFFVPLDYAWFKKNKTYRKKKLKTIKEKTIKIDLKLMNYSCMIFFFIFFTFN